MDVPDIHSRGVYGAGYLLPSGRHRLAKMIFENLNGRVAQVLPLLEKIIYEYLKVLKAG
jgi:hypothetical protein